MGDTSNKEGVLQYIEHLTPQTLVHKRKRDKRNYLGAVIIGVILLILAILVLILLRPTYEQRLALALTLILMYAIILFFMLEPHIVHEISHREIYHYHHPVYQEIIHEVEKPVIKIIEENKKPLAPIPQLIPKNSPLHPPKTKPPYVGSSQTLTYHKKDCKFVGLIDDKYKIEEEDPIWFDRKNYKKCKVCLKYPRR